VDIQPHDRLYAIIELARTTEKQIHSRDAEKEFPLESGALRCDYSRTARYRARDNLTRLTSIVKRNDIARPISLASLAPRPEVNQKTKIPSCEHARDFAKHPHRGW